MQDAAAAALFTASHFHYSIAPCTAGRTVPPNTGASFSASRRRCSLLLYIIVLEISFSRNTPPRKTERDDEPALILIYRGDIASTTPRSTAPPRRPAASVCWLRRQPCDAL